MSRVQILVKDTNILTFGVRDRTNRYVITENWEQSPSITNNGSTSRVCLPSGIKTFKGVLLLVWFYLIRVISLCSCAQDTWSIPKK